MNNAMESKPNVWLEAGVVWAAIEGTLSDGAHQNLTQRAVAMAAQADNWRLMFDYRRAVLTHDVLALSRHAELLTRLGLPGIARTAILCRQRSTNFVFWERVLGARGHVASAFTDGEAALSWLHRPAATGALAPGEAEPPQAAINVDSVKHMLLRFATERAAAPRSQVTAEFTALIECLFVQADQLGVDLTQGTEFQERQRQRGAENAG